MQKLNFIEKLNFIVISIYFISLSGMWISHHSPNMLSSPATKNNQSLLIQNSTVAFKPIFTNKPKVYLTNLNKELAESKPNFEKQDVSSFVYYYVDYNRAVVRIR